MVKLPKIKEKEKNLKRSKEKHYLPLKRARVTVNSSVGTTETVKQWNHKQ